MEPEISHRCPACGVAVRGTAVFCPQCGRPLKPRATGGGDKAAEAAETPARLKSDAGLNATIAPSSNLAETMPGKEALKSEASTVNNRPPAGATIPLAREIEERSRRQTRVMSVTRDSAEEKPSHRVEKLRHASSAMLEEASSDPGLRFVLVAIVIFLLSLLLLLINHLIG